MRDAVVAAATRLLLELLGRLPLSVARALGRAAGRLARALGTGEARVTERNLALCYPERSAAERARLAAASLAETGALAAELGRVWCRSPDRSLSTILSVDGEDVLRDAERDGRGVLVLVPHLGNWEVLNLWLARRGALTALYEPARNQRLDRWIHRCRERSGARLVPTDAAGIRVLLRTLRAGGTVGLLPDQVPPRSGGVHAPFLGVPALTMTLVARLLARTGARAVVGVAERVPGGFRLHFDAPAPGLDDADAVIAATALNRSVERAVDLAPAQYQWDYKRFKRPPPGTPPRYR